jgi:hypothetical protein
LTLLLTERVLTAQPSLVRALGLTKAVVLQQIQWHLTDAEHGAEHDGEWWYAITQAALADETGLTEDVVHRAIGALGDDGLLLSVQPEGWSSRRKWYRIDYDHPTLHSAESRDGKPRNGGMPSRESAASSSTKPLETSSARADLHLLESGQPTAREAYEDEFDRAWSVYPRKTARKAAFAAYRATRRRGVPGEVLRAATEAYATSRRGQPEEFTMHGATFYGASERWADHVAAYVEADVEAALDRPDLDEMAARAASGPRTGSRFQTTQPWETT